MREQIYAAENKVILIGRVGENEAQPVLFDISKLREQFGGGSVMLIHRRATDPAAYPCVVTVDGDTVTWIPSSGDTAIPGDGECELIYTVEDSVAKSVVYRVRVLRSLDDRGEVPGPWQSYIDQIEEDVQTAVNAKNDAVAAVGQAEGARDDAEDAKDDAEDARDAAQAAAASVSESAAQIETNRQNIADLDTAMDGKAALVHTHTAADVSFSAETAYSAGTVGAAIKSQSDEIATLDDEVLTVSETGAASLTNTLAFPFNNSKQSVALQHTQNDLDYVVIAEIKSATGNPGEILVTDKQVNGFKMAYTGSAAAVTVNYNVLGGLIS